MSVFGFVIGKQGTHCESYEVKRKSAKPFPRTQNSGGGEGQKTKGWVYFLTITIFGEHGPLVKLNSVNISKLRAMKQG